MKKIFFLLVITLNIHYFSSAQKMTAKERAAFIAKEDFSKSKYKKVEKYGITKEMSKVIISTPVIKNNIKDYAGIYKANGHDYILTLNVNDEKSISGTIKEFSENNPPQTYPLQNIIIKDALFKALKTNTDGDKVPLEGVFIDKNDNGTINFGLGLKLSESITINNTLHTNKLFFKKTE